MIPKKSERLAEVDLSIDNTSGMPSKAAYPPIVGSLYLNCPLENSE